MPLPLYVLPGMGADERLFAAHHAIRDIRPVPWIAPAHPREPLTEYAARLAHRIDTAVAFDLGGASFGGMVALELARHLSRSRAQGAGGRAQGSLLRPAPCPPPPHQVYLFGSCRSPAGVAPLLSAFHPLAAISPDRLLHPPRVVCALLARWFGATTSAHIDLFASMLAGTPPSFLRWAVRALFSWPGVDELPMPVHHIHGERDRAIPVHRVKPDRVIAGAGHLVNLTHPDAVNDFLA